MAKMFYSVEEAAQVLGKSEDDVIEMAKSGQIQEFLDRDKRMYKKEQIDLLSGHSEEDTGTLGDSEAGFIGLADSHDADVLMESREESVLGLEDSKESTGISIFDADELESADPGAATQISDTIEPMEFSLDNAGSGSGLLDLTREADDTSLGADLNMIDEEIYSGSEGSGEASGTGSGIASGIGGESGFFDTGSDETEAAGVGSGMVLPTVVETYDGGWSGAGVGFAVPALAALLLTATILMSLMVGTVAGIAESLASNYMVTVGAAAGVTIILGIVGFFVGKATG